MNKTLIFTAIVLFFIMSWLVNFINSLHDDVDVKVGFEQSDASEKGGSLYHINSFGTEILLLGKGTLFEKQRIWNASKVKKDMLAIFPNFLKMKELVQEKIEGSGEFKHALLDNLNSVEMKYISGEINGQSAKVALSSNLVLN